MKNFIKTLVLLGVLGMSMDSFAASGAHEDAAKSHTPTTQAAPAKGTGTAKSTPPHKAAPTQSVPPAAGAPTDSVAAATVAAG